MYKNVLDLFRGPTSTEEKWRHNVTFGHSARSAVCYEAGPPFWEVAQYVAGYRAKLRNTSF
jgi:hypothetical protein